MLLLNKIPGGADLEPQKASSKIISLEKYSHRKAAIAKPTWLPKSVQILNSNPSMNECESLNLFGSGILMTFKLSLSDLGNSDSFDNCYLPGKKVYTSIWEFLQFVVQEGSFGFLAGNCADYFSTELCSLNSNFKRSLKFNEYFRKVHMLFNNKSIIKLLGLVACIS